MHSRDLKDLNSIVEPCIAQTTQSRVVNSTVESRLSAQTIEMYSTEDRELYSTAERCIQHIQQPSYSTVEIRIQVDTSHSTAVQHSQIRVVQHNRELYRQNSTVETCRQSRVKFVQHNRELYYSTVESCTQQSSQSCRAQSKADTVDQGKVN